MRVSHRRCARRAFSCSQTKTRIVNDGSRGFPHPPSSSSSISVNPCAAEGDRHTPWSRDHLRAWWSQTCFSKAFMRVWEVSDRRFSKGRAANAASKTAAWVSEDQLWPVKEKSRGAGGITSGKATGLGNLTLAHARMLVDNVVISSLSMLMLWVL